jgi:hypothetical protein
MMIIIGVLLPPVAVFGYLAIALFMIVPRGLSRRGSHDRRRVGENHARAHPRQRAG